MLSMAHSWLDNFWKSNENSHYVKYILNRPKFWNFINLSDPNFSKTKNGKKICWSILSSLIRASLDMVLVQNNNAGQVDFSTLSTSY